MLISLEKSTNFFAVKLFIKQILFIEREKTSSELCNEVIFPESFRQIKILCYVFCFYFQDRIFYLFTSATDYHGSV